MGSIFCQHRRVAPTVLSDKFVLKDDLFAGLVTPTLEQEEVMKAHDFLFLKNPNTISAIIGGLLAIFALNVIAGPPPESFNTASELILTPSDQTFAADSGHGANLLLSNSALSAANPQQTEKRNSRPVNVGCGVDVNQFAGENSSLSNRLVGECNLKFRY
jgi:hypothetical protein